MTTAPDTCTTDDVSSIIISCSVTDENKNQSLSHVGEGSGKEENKKMAPTLQEASEDDNGENLIEKTNPTATATGETTTTTGATTTTSTEEESPSLPELPFVTTSDVLAHLNSNLQAVAAAQAQQSGENIDGLYDQPPKFELQKRLPDGSTMPASSADMAANDLQTKLQQSAAFVASLQTPEDKMRWAEGQRLIGNQYFQRGDYKTAMDVYLTCLVVKNTNSNTEKEEDSKLKETREESSTEATSTRASSKGGAAEDVSASSWIFLTETLIPILNNLAQCTLQLSMYKKTIEFVNIALEEIDKATKKEQAREPQQANINVSVEIDPLALCKLYYKRGKAQRLKGEYQSSRKDLSLSQQQYNILMLQERRKQQTEDHGTNDRCEQYLLAIQKEMKHLDLAEKEGRKNRQKQKLAMQRLLADTKRPNRTVESGVSKISTATGTTPSSSSIKGLYVDSNCGKSPPSAPRQYSTLRARRKEMAAAKSTNHIQKDYDKRNHHPNDSEFAKVLSGSGRKELSYWEYYWFMVARVSETLLVLLGDEETKEKLKKELEKEE